MSEPETKFEEDLKQFFPDIYKIHAHGKWDKFIWEVFDSMMEMVDASAYGEIKILYQHGRINQVIKSESRMQGKDNGQDLTKPGRI